MMNIRAQQPTFPPLFDNQQLDTLEASIERALTMVETLRKLNSELVTLQHVLPIATPQPTPVLPAPPQQPASLFVSMLRYFSEHRGEPTTTQHLLAALGGNESSMRAYLSRCTKSGLITRVRRNVYQSR